MKVGQLKVESGVDSWGVESFERVLEFQVIRICDLQVPNRRFSEQIVSAGRLQLLGCMKPISDARKRTLALQQRALEFSTGVNVNCPKRFTDIPSETIWRQLVRAADSVSNNLIEADDASSTADFVYKIRLTLREAKESRTCLEKLRMGRLDRFEAVTDLEREAGELCAIFATIAFNVADRIDRERRAKLVRPRRNGENGP